MRRQAFKELYPKLKREMLVPPASCASSCVLGPVIRIPPLLLVIASPGLTPVAYSATAQSSTMRANLWMWLMKNSPVRWLLTSSSMSTRLLAR